MRISDWSSDVCSSDLPLLLHLATADQHIGPDAQRAIHQALDDNRHVTIHDYEGKDHAFARAFGSSRDEEAANLADRRTAEFFDKPQIGRASCRERVCQYV